MTPHPTHSVRLHRVLRAKPERVYRAFLDADAMAKWLPPNGFTCKVHHLDAKVGGTFKPTMKIMSSPRNAWMDITRWVPTAGSSAGPRISSNAMLELAGIRAI